MHTGRKYRIQDVLWWTRRETFAFIMISAVPTVLYAVFNVGWIAIPWLPVALIGTAVAFIVGFKNNASYDRLWEARKIWGSIVNESRTWGIMAIDFVNNFSATKALPPQDLEDIRRRLVYRHIAWLTALRYQLREPRPWEHSLLKHNIEFQSNFVVPERVGSLESELRALLPEGEVETILSKKNRATQILKAQSADLRKLRGQGYIEDFRHLQLKTLLKDFFTHQGKCERIKNFPYPRQFATINRYFVWLFIFLAPLGMLEEFEQMGTHLVWLCIPFTSLVSWVFHTMEKIGDATENPFEGGANDIPMTALCRTIEIDLREMLNETSIPEPIEAQNHILM